MCVPVLLCLNWGKASHVDDGIKTTDSKAGQVFLVAEPELNATTHIQLAASFNKTGMCGVHVQPAHTIVSILDCSERHLLPLCEHNSDPATLHSLLTQFLAPGISSVHTGAFAAPITQEPVAPLFGKAGGHVVCTPTRWRLTPPPCSRRLSPHCGHAPW